MSDPAGQAEFEGMPTPVQMNDGDRVIIRTLWGEEAGELLQVRSSDETYPLAEVLLDKGDRIFVNIGRLRLAGEG